MRSVGNIAYLHDLIFFPCILHMLLLCILMIAHCGAIDYSNCLGKNIRFLNGDRIVSPDKVFELGFFTFDHDVSKSRYLGIWYHNMSDTVKIIIWVANRDKPMLDLDRSGYLIVKNGNAKVLSSRNNVTYWSTELTSSDNGSGNFTLCFGDSLGNTGNLVLKKRGERGDQFLWKSFGDPTDTYLPEMTDVANVGNLVSWKTSSNPSSGDYEFLWQLPGDPTSKLLILKNEQVYWESELTPFDHSPQTLYDFLFNTSSKSNETRLVMNFTGQIQLWKWKREFGRWDLNWSEPKNSCDLKDICGYFGSCNDNNGFSCNCLPGFTPSSPNNWNSGDHTEGCSPKSPAACGRNYADDVFLRMPMIKVNKPDSNDTTTRNCTATCLSQCNCRAYSCGASNCTGKPNGNCLLWNKELNGLQEESLDGLTIYVRTARSDIGATPRNCMPCGTYTIPYPLSTDAGCGDPSYLNFHCNVDTGQVSFVTSNGTFKVTSIDQEAKIFSIRVKHGSRCDGADSIVLSPQESFLYNVGNCNLLKGSFSEGEQSFGEIKVGWNPPPEPPCNLPTDCQDLPHTICKVKRKGGMRCTCRSNYHWDGKNMKCSNAKAIFIRKVVLCLAGALVIILLGGIFFIYHIRQRKLDEPQESLKEIDAEGVDVPIFNWESILSATNNFADSSKLGTGGFGSVYRGKLTDGQEIAVKRLSSVSVQGVEEFRTEVMLIAKLQHRNLVRLTGYCMKADEKILVYEYLPNGSLDSCLFDERHFVYLDWKKRYEIILGIARGLLYLHQDSRLRIIHRDLKPSNILLDEELNPKISDFGIARIVGGKETQASTGRVVGTHGYMSPEYAYEGIFSVKSDVFSFGVVVLETLSGRRNSRIYMFEHGLSLLGHAWKLWSEGKGLELMDPKLNESCLPTEVQKCIHIGLLCVQEDPSDRPTMSTVVYMLSGENAPLPPAKQPAFMNRKPLSESASSSSVKDMNMVQEVMTSSTVGR